MATEAAETACTLINRAVAGYLTAERTAASSPPARRRLRSAQQSRLGEQRDAAVIRIASITEAFCADRLIDEVEAEMDLPTAQRLLELWQSAAINATSSWKSQRDHYKDWLGIRGISWDFVMGVATARNSIAHGLGSLTRMQLKSRKSTETQLKNASIALAGDRVLIDASSLRSIATGCIAHLLAVDEAVSTRSR
ncbi:hypothetical protein [Cellulomonas sp. HD19AZ1]|uniref:hypothetical protein n=1 Tax=Cellulomonas sp. HD19AZ1 TaxID=2559593 RepID=UPI0010714D8B|nr:hypothetical protein [Cellulomonas sp. HD19AZ1]TFH70621.1 hypothetical protein E4A51_12755 [Cellulomonas sp. HD19AZ1]